MAKIISIVNQKGGVGKTTTTFNLAAAKALEGNSVLCIDLDAQASLSILCGYNFSTTTEKINSKLLFEKNIDAKQLILPTKFSKNVKIIAGDPALALTENELFLKTAKEFLLKDALEELKDYFDYIFLDCPPNLGNIVLNALVASDAVIIPVQTTYLSVRGLELILRSIKSVQNDSRLNPNLEIIGCIGTLYRKGVQDNETILNLLKEKSKYTYLGCIRQAADVNRADAECVPVVFSKPTCRAAVEYIRIATLF